MSVLGLDVGGANLKAAHTDGSARTVRFALWKQHRDLPAALTELIETLPPADRFALTMTGELCDCFSSKQEGVEWIVGAAEQVAAGRAVHVWRTDGRFAAPDEACRTPLLTASANWHALATWAGRLAPTGSAILLDIGSTTTDIIPLLDGKPVSKGKTDPERLKTAELVYFGFRRTPLAAWTRGEGAAELFATTHDLFLLLGLCDEDANDRDTADGRPATKEFAQARIARMLCADVETSTETERKDFAQLLLWRVLQHLCFCVERVARTLPAPPQTVIVAGSGEKLARVVIEQQTAFPVCRGIRLAATLGPERSDAACAHAVAVLLFPNGLTHE